MMDKQAFFTRPIRDALGAGMAGMQKQSGIMDKITDWKLAREYDGKGPLLGGKGKMLGLAGMLAGLGYLGYKGLGGSKKDDGVSDEFKSLPDKDKADMINSHLGNIPQFAGLDDSYFSKQASFGEKLGIGALGALGLGIGGMQLPALLKRMFGGSGKSEDGKEPSEEEKSNTLDTMRGLSPAELDYKPYKQ
jgi:hypothetical protein